MLAVRFLLKNSNKHIKMSDTTIPTFTQLCVMQGTLMPEADSMEESINLLVSFFKEQLNTDVKFADVVETLPDMDEYENPIEGTGGRSDLFFYVSDSDIPRFALARLQYGIRWWEDVLGNGHGNLYPQEILEKYPKT